VKAVGELDVQNLRIDEELPNIDPLALESLRVGDEAFIEIVRNEADKDEEIEIPMEHHYEIIDGKKNWVLTTADIRCLAEGCGILGAGGGGSPYLTALVCENFQK